VGFFGDRDSGYHVRLRYSQVWQGILDFSAHMISVITEKNAPKISDWILSNTFNILDIQHKSQAMSSTDVGENDDAFVATAMKALRTKEGTKKGYGLKAKAALIWFEKNRPDCIGSDGRLEIPIPTNAVSDYLGSLCKNGFKRSQVKEGEDIPEGQAEPCAYSTLSSHRSAIKDLYTQAGVGPTAELDTEIRKIVVGYQKLLNDLKKRGLFSITEGKHPLASRGFYLLAAKLLRFDPTDRPVGGQGSTGSFAWAFFLLMWNLMSRTETVDAIMLQHIGWSEDSLIIQEQGHKGDQTGEAKYWKHIYANPGDPAICPILALAVVVFAGPARDTLGRQQIFLGSNNKDRFAKTLRQVVTNLPEADLQVLGCERADIGPYSLRKGSASFCLGQVAGPNPVTVQLRMGHSLGKVNDAYFYVGDGQDQLTGRMIAGLPFNDEGFAVLPPHFCTEVNRLLTLDFWGDVVGGYELYPDGFKAAFPFLLASLFYHEEFLKQHLYSTHPLWNSRVFVMNEHLTSMRAEGAIMCGIGCCPETGLKATGIPPHLAIAGKVQTLIDECKRAHNDSELMRERIFAELPAAVARCVGEELRSNFIVDGVAPVSLHDINRRFDDMEGVIMRRLDQLGQNVGGSVPGGGAAASAPEHQPTWWRTWDWNDGVLMHYIPLGWRWPTGITCKQVWDLWFYGNMLQVSISPYIEY
jgi:hypothetical protein